MVPRGQCFADAPNYSGTMPSNPCSAASSCALAAASAARNRFFTLDDDGLGVVHRQTPRPQRGWRRGLRIILLMWNDRKLGLREFSAVVFGCRWRGSWRISLSGRGLSRLTALCGQRSLAADGWDEPSVTPIHFLLGSRMRKVVLLVGLVLAACNSPTPAPAGDAGQAQDTAATTADAVADAPTDTAPACPSQTPLKLPGSDKCVECVNDSHCAGSSKGSQCEPTQHVCSSSACDLCAGTAKPWCVLDTCVECAFAANCPEGQTCDANSHTCGASDPCANCPATAPKCWKGGSKPECVECLTDSDCFSVGATTCDASAHTCSTASVNSPTTMVLPPGPATGTCTSDNDCKNASGSAFVLHCDSATGLCWDEGGNCDNVSAFCNVGAGSECTALATWLGGIPGESPTPQCSCPLPGAATSTSTEPLPNQGCQAAQLLDPNVAKGCDCSKDPQAPECTIKPFLYPNPVDCCKGGGATVDPLSCISLPPPAASPACFGGSTCGQDLYDCLSGVISWKCGALWMPGLP